MFAWLILRRSVDLIVIKILIETFGTAKQPIEILQIFLKLPDLSQIGVITALLIIVATTVGIIASFFDAVRAVFKRNRRNKA